MQALFGALGVSSSADDVFARLVELSLDSTPGLTPSIVAEDAARIGHVARSFAAWHRAGGRRSVYLAGELLAIDGRDTKSSGRANDELEQISILYDRVGPDLWERLEGTFSIVLVDGRAFRIAVDLAGTRGLYWWYHDGVLAFHSYLEDLAPAYPGALVEDAGAIGHFLECGHYPPGATVYRNIRHLGAGQCLTFADDTVTVGEHFRMRYADQPSSASPDTLADELVSLISTSVGRSWRAAREPVVPLSGGVDSRYLVAELVTQAGDPTAVRTITWGEDRDRPGSDATVAAQVAATLGVENVWHEKRQRLTPDVFERAIYLSSGEADCALHYPEDHLLHEALVAQFGFGSLFRGDELFGFNSPVTILTDRAILPGSLIARLALDDGYNELIAPDVLGGMADEQEGLLRAAAASLRSRTPHARMEEAWYEFGHRRELAIYNAVKNVHLETYNPLLDRQVLEWVKTNPDDLRAGKKLVRAAFQRRFPQLARIPYATRSNLPSWEHRMRHDPAIADFLLEWCSRPGWLVEIGSREAVLRALTTLRETASRPAPPGTGRPSGDRPAAWRGVVKRTIPGRLLREWTLERRYARHNVSLYLRLARLAVLHGLLGRVAQRQGARLTAVPASARPDGPAVRDT